jgi:hypothetical protein
MFESFPAWGLLVILGPVVLGLAIAYALIGRRRLTPKERGAQIRATERGYREPEKID